MGSNGATASGVCIEWGAMLLLLVEYALSGSNGATASGVCIKWGAMVLLQVEYALSGEQWCYF